MTSKMGQKWQLYTQNRTRVPIDLPFLQFLKFVSIGLFRSYLARFTSNCYIAFFVQLLKSSHYQLGYAQPCSGINTRSYKHNITFLFAISFNANIVLQNLVFTKSIPIFVCMYHYKRHRLYFICDSVG